MAEYEKPFFPAPPKAFEEGEVADIAMLQAKLDDMTRKVSSLILELNRYAFVTGDSAGLGVVTMDNIPEGTYGKLRASELTSGYATLEHASNTINEVSATTLINASGKIGANLVVSNSITAGTIVASNLAASAVTADKININGSIVVSATGNIRQGKTAYNNTTSGFFLGDSGTSSGHTPAVTNNTPIFHVGNATEYIYWNGSTPIIKATDVYIGDTYNHVDFSGARKSLQISTASSGVAGNRVHLNDSGLSIDHINSSGVTDGTTLMTISPGNINMAAANNASNLVLQCGADPSDALDNASIKFWNKSPVALQTEFRHTNGSNVIAFDFNVTRGFFQNVELHSSCTVDSAALPDSIAYTRTGIFLGNGADKTITITGSTKIIGYTIKRYSGGSARQARHGIANSTTMYSWQEGDGAVSTSIVTTNGTTQVVFVDGNNGINISGENHVYEIRYEK